MKFDFIIGNPPYQEDIQNKGDRANPIYDKFMDEAYQIADKSVAYPPAGNIIAVWILKDHNILPRLLLTERVQKMQRIIIFSDKYAVFLLTFRLKRFRMDSVGYPRIFIFYQQQR